MTAAAVAATVLAEATATVTAGMKRQQSTSDGSVEGGLWTEAQQRVMTNSENTWRMMRAVTKRAARAMATVLVMRVVGEQQQRW
jgi:hypothetical protein